MRFIGQELHIDPLWQFIVMAILSILSIIVPIVIRLKDRNRKELSFEVMSHAPLLRIMAGVEKKLQVLFEGKSVESVRLALIRIANSGNVPIEAKDYERPISFIFGEKVQVLTADVVETYPKSLQVSPQIDGHKVELPKVLLNKGDSFLLKILLSGWGACNIDGRIIGIKEIQWSRISPIRDYSGPLWMLGTLLILLGSFLPYTGIYRSILDILNLLGLLLLSTAFWMLEKLALDTIKRLARHL